MQPAYKLAPQYAGGAGDLALMAQTPEQLSSAQDARFVPDHGGSLPLDNRDGITRPTGTQHLAHARSAQRLRAMTGVDLSCIREIIVANNSIIL